MKNATQKLTSRAGLTLAAAALLLAGCGGGDDGGSDTVESEMTSIQQPQSTASTSIPTVCGYMAGDKTLQGTVVKVYDGDTITVQDAAGTKHSIRLDSIDAPELNQTYGNFSQAQLARSVLNESVTVAYSKTDQYNRIVGTVFKSNCEYVNKNQVATGAAWFYKAYQCEIAAPLRTAFADDQNAASASKSGLWSETGEPEAPWFYRNGTEPETPTCTSDYPKWVVDAGLTSGTATSSGATAPTTPNASTDDAPICYIGPRGGRYTITASGNRNYNC